MNVQSKIFPPKRISDALFWCTKKLNHLENPKLEAEVILSEILGQERSYLKTHPQSTLSKKARWKLNQWTRKRAKHIPMAYIKGYKQWNGIKIAVNKHVLIPRDETEILTQKIIEQNNSSIRNILDIGTGSGCIALFLKKSYPNAQVFGIDISKSALHIAKKNAKNLKTDVHFFCSNLLSNIKKKSHFDIIVANLPYVPESVEVSAEVQKEPHNAIFAKDDGLFLVKQLQKELEEKNITFGELWLEFLPQQKEAVKKIFSPWKCKFETDIGGDVFFAKMKLV